MTAAAEATSRVQVVRWCARPSTASASVSGTAAVCTASPDCGVRASSSMAARSSSMCSGMPSLRSWIAATTWAGADRPSTALVMVAVWSSPRRFSRISSPSRWASSRARRSRSALEGGNPTGSYKDRMALAVVEGAERRGALRRGQRVDAETLRDMFCRLSGDSRQHRFLKGLRELDDSMIRRLVDSVDGVHHIALVLVVLPPEGEQRPVGAAHLWQDPNDPTTGDIADTVVDGWQGRGVGTALLSALMERRPAAVTRLCTVVEADNRASLALLAGAGRMSLGMPEQGVLDVTVELAWA